MGIFSKIRDAILPNRDKPEQAQRPAAATTAAAQKPAAQQPAARPAPMDGGDVEQRLDAMEGAEKLNWRSSIVDLMKLIGVDSGFANRKELAGELGKADYAGTAEENIWLHRRTMQELAKNGGRVPQSFLD